MSRDSCTWELVSLLNSSDLKQLEQVRVSISQQLNTDRGLLVLSVLLDFYLDSSSAEAALLLCSIREPLDKPLLDRLTDCMLRPPSRLATLSLLGNIVRKQPSWIHKVSRSPLLSTLLKCLKTDSDLLVLVTGVLVLVTLLPMIPQCGKTHIYDFFDVFGRLAAWGLKNPGDAPAASLLHLQASVYCLFHRLYGMFPCNFMSYLRLHYSMKENLSTFHSMVQPMLKHVRLHPELVSGTQDSELDPSRWKCYEVHDIVIECAGVSLDPREWSCPPHLDLGAMGSPAATPVSERQAVLSYPAGQSPYMLCEGGDVTWSPSSQCGLATPPASRRLPPVNHPEASLGPAHPPGSTASISGLKCPSVATAEEPPQCKQQPIEEHEAAGSRPIRDEEKQETNNNYSEEVLPPALCPASSGAEPAYQALFHLALPTTAPLFLGSKTQEVLQKAGVEQSKSGVEEEEECSSLSPLEVLERLMVQGEQLHHTTTRRPSKTVDWSQIGGSHSMKSKGSTQGEEIQLQSQLLLVHSQLQYERYKRQQHAVRNRRLLRRVLNATALEEHAVSMKDQLRLQEVEVESLRCSLQQEQQRAAQQRSDAHTHTAALQRQILKLQDELQQESSRAQLLQTELLECQGMLGDLEAELQKANNEAYNAQHQLTQLSAKVWSSEDLQQQVFLLNRQLLLTSETNRLLQGQLEGPPYCSTQGAHMLQCIVGRKQQNQQSLEAANQRVSDLEAANQRVSDLEAANQRVSDLEAANQRVSDLEAANQRVSDLEALLSKKEQLISDQKKLLEETKMHSREELAACESRYVSLKSVSVSVYKEMLQLYTLVDGQRPNGSLVTMPTTQDKPRPPSSSSSSFSIINGGVELLSTSPLHLPSSSPADSSLPMGSWPEAGSFLEQRARHLFRPAPQEEEQDPEEDRADAPEGGVSVGQEPEEEPALGTLPPRPAPGGQVDPRPSGLRGAPVPSGPEPPEGGAREEVQQRKEELSIMDYDETLPDY